MSTSRTVKERIRRRFPFIASVGSFVLGFFAGQEGAFLTAMRVLF